MITIDGPGRPPVVGGFPEPLAALSCSRLRNLPTTSITHTVLGGSPLFREQQMAKHDIGLIGLAVMGQNLVMNMANKGFNVAVYNRTTETMTEFVNGLGSRPEGVVEDGAADRIHGYEKLEDFVNSLESPRRIMIMVKAGGPCDAVINQLKPLLDKGDIIIDGGNADYTDTNRRHEELKAEGFRFIGTGVSGGEEGALKGPSIMPGGHPEAWPFVKDILQKISAKVGENNDIPCCDWVGEAGAGHYVKMVHK